MSFWSSKKAKRNPSVERESVSYEFRRSRTLTGTTSSRIQASAETRSQLLTDRQKSLLQRQKRRRFLTLIMSLMVLLIVIFFFAVNFIETYRFQYVQNGSNTPPTTQYAASLADYFAKHPWQRFGFMLNETGVTSALESDHPEISDVAIIKQWYGGGVQFLVTFRQPILMWRVGDKQVYVDNSGAAFTYDYFKGNYIVVSDQSGVGTLTANNVLASQQMISFVGRMVNAVSANNQGKVISVVIPPNLTREIDIRLQGRNYTIKTDIDRDPLQQAQDIKNALAWFDQHKITPIYIDLRVAGKAFYK